MNRTATLATALRVVAAALVLAGGGIHLKLYNDGYKDFPNDNLGRSFLLNVAASVVVAVAIVVWRHWLGLVAGLLVVDATLFAFGLSRTSKGIFGFTETGFNPSPEAALALIVEIAAAVTLVFLLAWEREPAAT
jgi:hypothetical protein